jgi:hypothetical protein
MTALLTSVGKSSSDSFYPPAPSSSQQPSPASSSPSLTTPQRSPSTHGVFVRPSLESSPSTSPSFDPYSQNLSGLDNLPARSPLLIAQQPDLGVLAAAVVRHKISQDPTNSRRASTTGLSPVIGVARNQFSPPRTLSWRILLFPRHTMLRTAALREDPGMEIVMGCQRLPCMQTQGFKGVVDCKIVIVAGRVT